MSKQSTSFSVKDAKFFLEKCQEFEEIIQQEWSKVLNQWSNLKATWHDEQFYQFDPLFEALITNYRKAKFEYEVYIKYITNQLETLRKINPSLLEIFNKSFTVIQAVGSLVETGVNPPPLPQNFVGPTQPSNSLSAQAQNYQSLPKIARSMSREDQLGEAYQKQKDEQNEESKKAIEVESDQSKTDASPPNL
jgi:hypothetical protein